MGGCVVSLVVDDAPGRLFRPPAAPWPLERLLASLPSGVLEILRLNVMTQHLPATLVQALPRFPLRSLSLTAYLPPELPAVLRELHRLTSLKLAHYPLPDGTLPAVLTLSGLQGLTLISMGGALPHCDQLTTLHQLRRLEFIELASAEDAPREPLRLPAPADFPHLSEYYCSPPDRGVQVGCLLRCVPFKAVLATAVWVVLAKVGPSQQCTLLPQPMRHRSRSAFAAPARYLSLLRRRWPGLACSSLVPRFLSDAALAV